MINQPDYRTPYGVAEVRSDKVLQQTTTVTTASKRWYVKVISFLADLLDECLGTLYLIFFVAGSQVIDQYSENIGLGALEINAVTKGFISGLALIGIIIAFGGRSGGHFNPVVTLACMLRGHCSIIRGIFYWAAQFGGGCAGAGILRAIFGNLAFLGTTIPTSSNGKAVGLEIMLTFIFLVVILTVSERQSVADRLRYDNSVGTKISEETRALVAAIIIGFIFGAVQSFGWNLSGSSVNPWRSFCPALVSGGSKAALRSIWVYFLGPICGSILAVIYRYLCYGVDVTLGVQKVSWQTMKGHFHPFSRKSSMEVPLQQPGQTVHEPSPPLQINTQA